MKRWSPTMLLVFVLPMVVAKADEAAKTAEPKRIPAHKPEWSNPDTSDPGVAESTASDLQRIVVLCATEPQSAEFRKEWADYVHKNYEPGMDIDAVIDEVLRKADAHRARQRSRSGTTPARAIQQKKATRKMMHDTAMASIRNTRA